MTSAWPQAQMQILDDIRSLSDLLHVKLTFLRRKDLSVDGS